MPFRAVVTKLCSLFICKTVRHVEGIARMIGSTWWSLYRSTDLGDTWYATDPRKKLKNKKVLRNGSVVESSTVVINFKNPQLASEIELKPSVKIFASEARAM